MPRSRFTTCIKKYSVNTEPLVFPIRFGPNELNKTIKKLLQDNDIDTNGVNFNFFINGERLTVGLNEFIEAKGISEEIEEIVYDIDFEPPNAENETKAEEFITGMKFQSKWIATAAFDVQIFDINSPGQPVVIIPADEPLWKVDWVSINEETNEAALVAGGSFRKLGMWKCNLSDGTSSQIFDYLGHKSDISSLSVSHDKTLLASGSTDGMLKIWSASTHASDLSDETGGIPHVSKNKQKVPTRIPIVTVNAHNHGSINVQWLASPISLNNDFIESGAASNSGNLLTCGDDFYLKLWNINGYESHIVREVKASTHLRSMAVNNDNQIILTAAADTRLRVFDMRAQTAEIHNVLNAHFNSTLSGVKWSPSNSNIFMTTCTKGTTKLWDFRSMKEAIAVVSSFNSPVTCCDWRADGQYVATAYLDKSLKFYKFNM